MSWQEIRPLLVEATARLIDSLERIHMPQQTPSALTGWSQAHVLTHLARNADGMRNLFLAARSGMFVGMYASPEIREADIMTGATRAPTLLRLDVEVSAERLLIDLDAMPDQAWAAAVPMSADPDAMRVPTPLLARFRLAEVELHHLDLEVGHSLDQTPADTLESLLGVAHLRLRERTPPFTLDTGPGRELHFGEGDGPTVSGSTAAAFGWLSGRSDGDTLAVTDGDGLPDLPPY